MTRSVLHFSIIICIAITYGCGGDSKLVSSIKTLVLADATRNVNPHVICIKGPISIDRVEKGNPSKELSDKYNPKSVYCVRCRCKEGQSVDYIAIENQTGTVSLISQDSLYTALLGNNRNNTFMFTGKRGDDLIRRTNSAASVIMDGFWKTTCPFQ